MVKKNHGSKGEIGSIVREKVKIYEALEIIEKVIKTKDNVKLNFSGHGRKRDGAWCFENGTWTP